MQISDSTKQQSGQVASKYPLGTRVIAWTIVAVLIAGVGWIVWDAIAEGNTARLVMAGIVGAGFGWRSYRNTIGAKSR